MEGIWVVAFVLQWILVLLLVVLSAGTLRYLASVQERLALAAPHVTRYELGEKLSPFELPALAGSSVSLGDLIGNGRNSLFLLVQAGCASCTTLMLQVAALGTNDGGWDSLGWSPIFICAGDPDEIENMVRDAGMDLTQGVILLVDAKREIPRQWGARNVPTGLAVDNDGRVVAQSFNPHQNWLYKVVDVLPPSTPVVASKNHGDPMRVPAGFEEISSRIGPIEFDARKVR